MNGARGRAARARERIRARPVLELSYRISVAIVGLAIVLIGLVMVPAPGPGWLVVFAGLAVLATEFAWARALLRHGRSRLHAWTEWARRRSLLVRLLIGLLGIALLVGVALVGAYSVGWRGFPYG